MATKEKAKLKLNTRLIRRIQKHILVQPKRFDMADFLLTGHSLEWRNDLTAPECGTVGCISGWACALNGERPRTSFGFWKRAKKFLGLTKNQAQSLFQLENWPEKYQKRYNSAPVQSKKRATIAAKLLDEVVATKGVILDEAYQAQQEQ